MDELRHLSLCGMYIAQARAGFAEATTRLTSKKGNSGILAGRWPMPLMDNDYKIFTALIRNRVSPTADKFISIGLVGFIDGWSIDINPWIFGVGCMEYQVSGTPRAMILYGLQK